MNSNFSASSFPRLALLFGALLFFATPPLVHAASPSPPPKTPWTSPSSSSLNATLIYQWPPYNQVIALASESSSSGRMIALEQVISITNKNSRHQISWLIPPPSGNGTWTRKAAASLDQPAQGLAYGYGGVFVSTSSRLLFLQDTNHDDSLESSRILIQGLTSDQNTSARYSHLQWGPDGALYGILTGTGFKDLPRHTDSARDAIHLNPGIVRYSPISGRFEPMADGPALLVDLSIGLDRSIQAFRSIAPSEIRIVPGCTYLPPHGYPPAWNPSAIAVDLPGAVSNPRTVSTNAGYLALGQSLWIQTSRGMEESRISLKPGARALEWSQGKGASELPVEITLHEELTGLGMSTSPQGVPGLLTRHIRSGTDQLWALLSQPSSTPTDSSQSSSSPHLTPALMHQEIRRSFETPSTQHVARLKSWATPTADIHEEAIQTASLWALHGLSALPEEIWRNALRSSSGRLRATALTIASENPGLLKTSFPILQARLQDPEPEVRQAALLSIASICESLHPETDASQPRVIPNEWIPLWEAAIAAAGSPTQTPDHALAWRATESLFLSHPLTIFDRLTHKATTEGASDMMLDLIRRTVQRSFATGRDDLTGAILDRMESLSTNAPAIAATALEGMADGQRGSKRWTHYKRAGRLLSNLATNADPVVAETAERLEALAGNPETQKRILSRIQDSTAPTQARYQAIQFAKNFNSQASRLVLLQLLQQPYQAELHPAAVRAISKVGKREEARALLSMWPQWNKEMQRETSAAFASRNDWMPMLVDALESQRISPSDLGDEALQAIRQSPDPDVRLRGLRQITRKP